MKKMKMNQKFFRKGLTAMIVVSLFLSFMACQPKPKGTTNETPKDTVKETPMTREAMVSKINSMRQQVDNLAMKGGSIEEASKFFTDDYMMMEPNRPTFNGKKAYLDRVDSLVKSGVKINSVKRTVIDVWQSGDRIYEIGTAEFKLKIPRLPGPTTDPTAYFTIWQTQADGSMKMKYSIWNTQRKMVVE